MPSCRAALSMIGSSIPMIWAPPGPRCAAFGGVFVYCAMPRKRMFPGVYTRSAIWLALFRSPAPYAPLSWTMIRSMAVHLPSALKPIFTKAWKPGRARPM